MILFEPSGETVQTPFGLIALALGAVVGRFAWNASRSRPPEFEFGSELKGFDRVIVFASIAELFGALLGVWLSARRSPP
jgi:hypothetical protein